MCFLPHKQRAFTLAELLIALAILGVIATFTIPKVLQSQNDNKFKAIAKETAAMVSGAYQSYKMNNVVTNTTTFADLTPYMNYVSLDNSSANNIDRTTGSANIACSNSFPCLRLHNGAAVLYAPADPFGGTNNTDAIYFYLDPDGQDSGTTNGVGKSVVFFLYYDGKITTWGNLFTGTRNNGSGYAATPASDPTWFAWN